MRGDFPFVPMRQGAGRGILSVAFFIFFGFLDGAFFLNLVQGLRVRLYKVQLFPRRKQFSIGVIGGTQIFILPVKTNFLRQTAAKTRVLGFFSKLGGLVYKSVVFGAKPLVIQKYGIFAGTVESRHHALKILLRGLHRRFLRRKFFLKRLNFLRRIV